LKTYKYQFRDNLTFECDYEIDEYEPAVYSDGVLEMPEYPMSINVFTVKVNGEDLYDMLSGYFIQAIETEILMDLQK